MQFSRPHRNINKPYSAPICIGSTNTTRIAFHESLLPSKHY